MALAIGEAHHLVLDRRAIARARARRSSRNRPPTGARPPGRSVRLRRRSRDVAGRLTGGGRLRVDREELRRIVAVLDFERRPVDRAPVEPRRRSGLQPAEGEARAARGSAASDTEGASPNRPAGVRDVAEMDDAAQEGAGRQHDRAAGEAPAVRERDARDGAVRRSRSPTPRPRRTVRPGVAAISARMARR